MVNGGCVRGYLASLVKAFWNQGVRRAGDDFFPMIREKSWEFYLDQVERMKDGSHAIDWENDPVILLPIFTGPYSGGHFSLLVVDRTRYSAGLFLYFDSLPSMGKGIAIDLEVNLLHLQRSEAFAEHNRGSVSVGCNLWVKAECRMSTTEVWGQQGRKHIEKSLRTNKVDFTDTALTFLSVVLLT
jgi:hypothetical protein